MDYTDKDVKASMAESRSRQLANRSLIDSAFPSQGTPQPNHMGSQSSPPPKEDTQYSNTQDKLNQ